MLHKTFDMLKENIREQIKTLEETRNKRQLIEKEEKIVRQFKKYLEDAKKICAEKNSEY